jgi:uncharacterized protein YjbI with pentapeptide repeats
MAKLAGATLAGADLYNAKFNHTLFDRTCLQNVDLGNNAFVAFDLDTIQKLQLPVFV